MLSTLDDSKSNLVVADLWLRMNFPPTPTHPPQNLRFSQHASKHSHTSSSPSLTNLAHHNHRNTMFRQDLSSTTNRICIEISSWSRRFFSTSDIHTITSCFPWSFSERLINFWFSIRQPPYLNRSWRCTKNIASSDTNNKPSRTHLRFSTTRENRTSRRIQRNKKSSLQTKHRDQRLTKLH